jgi:hypothetical protein
MHPAYQGRVARLFEQFAELVAKGDPTWNTPDLDIEDVRARFRPN